MEWNGKGSFTGLPCSYTKIDGVLVAQKDCNSKKQGLQNFIFLTRVYPWFFKPNRTIPPGHTDDLATKTHKVDLGWESNTRNGEQTHTLCQ